MWHHRFQPSPFLKDVFLTAVTSALTLVSLVYSLRLIAQGLGSSEFGAYCLSRQILSAAIPFSTVGMGVSLARCGAMGRSEWERHTMLLVAFLVVTAVLLPVFVLAVAFNEPLTLLAFREATFAPLFLGTLCLLGAYSYYSVLYGFYRGSNAMGKANGWQIITMALIPAVAALGWSRYGKAELIVLSMAVLSAIALAPLVFFVSKAVKLPKGGRSLLAVAEELIGYGLPRVPGGLAYAGILAVGPFLAPYFGSLKEAGYLVVGQSLFRIVEGAIEAFGIVALPRVAALFSQERQGFLGQRINDIVIMILHLGLFMTARLFLWSDWIIAVWIGTDYVEAAFIVRILSLGLIPYLAFAMLRSFVDGIQKRAVMTLYLFLSFGFTAATSILLAKSGLGANGLAIGTVLGILCLSGLTLRYLHQIGMLKVKGLLMTEVLAVNAAFFVASALLKFLLSGAMNSLSHIGLAVVGEIFLLSLYLGLLWRKRVTWMMELRKRLVSGPKG